MVKARPPRSLGTNIRTILAALIVGAGQRFLIALLIISGAAILVTYNKIVLGVIPSDIEKIRMDYSITIFTGCALFLLLYRHEWPKIVKEIFNVKELPFIDKN